MGKGEEESKVRLDTCSHVDSIDTGRQVMVSLVVRRDDIERLGPELAILVSFLRSQNKYNGWIHCTTKYLKKELAISPATQARYFRELIELGQIEVEQRENRERWIRLISD